MNNSKYSNRGKRLSSSTDASTEDGSVTTPPRIDSSSARGIVSNTVQSLCTLLDHQGHHEVIETLTEEKRNLEEQLQNLKALRVQWATPAHFYDTLKHARRAKWREEDRNNVLRLEMTCLREELSQTVLLPIALEAQVNALRDQLEITSKELEMEKKMRLEAVLSEKECVQKFDTAYEVLKKQEGQLQQWGRKLGRNATIIDQLSAANCDARETVQRMEQEVDIARVTRSNAEKRMALAEEGAAMYRAGVEEKFALLTIEHAEIVTSLKNAAEATSEEMRKMMVAKDAEIQMLSGAITEAKEEASEMKAKVRQCSEAANARVRTVLQVLVVRDEQIRRLKLAVKDTRKASSNELKSTVEEKDAQIRQVSAMLASANRRASSLEISAKKALELKLAAEVKINELSGDIQTRDLQIDNLRHALKPNALREETSHKLQSYIIVLQRDLLHKDRCINDLNRVIRVIRATPAATSSTSNDQLATLKKANVQLKNKASSSNVRYSKAVATIRDMATKMKETEEMHSQLILENQTLREDLLAKGLLVSGLSNGLKTSENRNIELEERLSDREAQNTTLISEREHFEKTIKSHTSLINNLGCRLFNTVREGVKLRSELNEAERFGETMESQSKTLEVFNNWLALERTRLTKQLATAHADIDDMTELKVAQDEQSRSLKIKLFAEVGKLRKAKARAQWTISTLNAQVEGLQESNVSLFNRFSDSEKEKEVRAGVIRVLEGKLGEAALKLQETEADRAEISTLAKSLRDTILEKDLHIANLNDQLGEIQKKQAPIAENTIAKPELVRNGVEVASTNGSQTKWAQIAREHPAKINFAQTRSRFEQSSKASDAQNASPKVTPPTATVVPRIIRALEDGTVRAPLTGRGIEKRPLVFVLKSFNEPSNPSPPIRVDEREDESKGIDGSDEELVDKSDVGGSDGKLIIEKSDSTGKESVTESSNGEQVVPDASLEIGGALSDEDSDGYDVIDLDETQSGFPARSQWSSSSPPTKIETKSQKKRGFLKRLKKGLKKGLTKRL